MIFQEKQSLKVQAPIANTTSKITLDGIKTSAFTPEEAKTNMDILLNIVSISVNTNGMIRTRTEEAVENV